MRRNSKNIHVSHNGDNDTLFDDEETYRDQPILGRTVRYNRVEWPYILIGASIRGAAWPALALISSKVTARLGQPGSEADIRVSPLCTLCAGARLLLGMRCRWDASA